MSKDLISFFDALEVPGAVKTAFFAMGYCLYHVQAVELVLKSCLTTSFALQDLESEDRALRKKTLGSLLNQLRQRVDIDEDLEDLFTVFVEERNQFVHQLLRQFQFEKLEGLADMANFCQILAIRAQELSRFLNAALSAAHPEIEVDDDVRELVPIIDFYLRRKHNS
jgi:hypothetical protein